MIERVHNMGDFTVRLRHGGVLHLVYHIGYIHAIEVHVVKIVSR